MEQTVFTLGRVSAGTEEEIIPFCRPFRICNADRENVEKM